MNPKYYDKMSQLLHGLIDQRRQGAIDYKQYPLHPLSHPLPLSSRGKRLRTVLTR